MLYIFNSVFAWIESYRAWLSKKKFRAETVLYTPIVVTFFVVLFAPVEFFEWYYSSEIVALLAPVLIFPLLPFYVVTCFEVFRKSR